VLVARRITDHVALALSHRRLAEQARHNEELRARTEKTELLDELLAALIDSGDLPDVFGRVSVIARKVLPHDAAALMVRLADGNHARLYASSGFPPSLPEIAEIPGNCLRVPTGSTTSSMTCVSSPARATCVSWKWGSIRCCGCRSGSPIDLPER
jgi:hypothetical protein